MAEFIQSPCYPQSEQTVCAHAPLPTYTHTKHIWAWGSWADETFSPLFQQGIIYIGSQAPTMVLKASWPLCSVNSNQEWNPRPEITEGQYFTFWRVYNSRMSLEISRDWGIGVLLRSWFACWWYVTEWDGARRPVAVAWSESLKLKHLCDNQARMSGT